MLLPEPLRILARLDPMMRSTSILEIKLSQLFEFDRLRRKGKNQAEEEKKIHINIERTKN